MTWTMIEDTPGVLLRWQCRLTAEAPETEPQSLALLSAATVQLEGDYGAAVVELRVSNSGAEYVPFEMRSHPDLLTVPFALSFKAVALDADASTNVLLTLVGRR